MIIPAFIEHVGKATSKACRGFVRGWTVGALILAGGKVWTLLNDPRVKVSDSFGHVGTSAFRHQLAVGYTVDHIAKYLFTHLEQKFAWDKNSDERNTYKLMASVISAAAGCIIAAKASPQAYQYLKIGVVVVVAAKIGMSILAPANSK